MKILNIISSPRIFILGLFLSSHIIFAKDGVLIVHGLNNDPTSLQDIADYAQKLGAEVERVTLEGHDKNQPIYRERISADQWLCDLENSYLNLKQRADRIFVVGYSLGGALSILSHIEDNNIEFDGMVLLAPGIVNRDSNYWLEPLGKKLGEWNRKIPSFSEARVHRWTTWEYYQSLLDIQERIQQKSLRQYTKLNMPVQVLMDQKDMLISWDGIVKFMTDKKLKNWYLQHFDSNSVSGHYVFAKKWLKEGEWSKLETAMKKVILSR